MTPTLFMAPLRIEEQMIVWPARSLHAREDFAAAAPACRRTACGSHSRPPDNDDLRRRLARARCNGAARTKDRRVFQWRADAPRRARAHADAWRSARPRW